jgi:trimeric autotransporter adhesin
MKHLNFLITLIVVFLGSAGTQAFATRVYAPNTVRDMSAARSYCQGATGRNIRFRYYTCNVGTGTRAGVALTASWYQNTVDATTGGTLVSSSSVTTTTSGTGSLVYIPSTATPGVFYYYCTLTWTDTTACNASGSLTSTTTMITVNQLPDTIVGPDVICIGSPVTYTNSVAGGTWRSSSVRATIDTFSGEASGVTNGRIRIYYRIATCAAVNKLVSVSATPTVNAITGGTANVCVGASALLRCSPTAGGVWSSGNTAIATIGTSHRVEGVSPGTATITYTRTNGCGSVTTTKDVTVSTTPAAITGASSTCASYTLTYSNSVLYGTWTSSNTTVATVSSNTGVISALSAGTAIITYNTGCTPRATQVLTVNASPAAITGTLLICDAGTSALSTTTPGGTWSSSDPSVATIDASGLVTAVSYGTAAISYTLATSCDAVAIVTVGATPASISGVSSICSDGTANLTNATNYGSWSSSDVAVATIDDAGLVSPVSQGTTTISYNTGCGTAATMVMNVYTQPVDIAGTPSVCDGSTTSLTNATSGGVWSSDASSIASVNSSGVVTGISEGVADITYMNGVCFSTLEVSVNPLPVPGSITGALSVCDGDFTDLDSDGDLGGSWTSSNASVATVNSSGMVTGHSAGTVGITYSVTNGCGTLSTNVEVTVNADPAAGAISGATTVCESATTALSDASSGGVWTSSSNTIATVGTDGVVSGIAGGNATITYTISNSCGADYVTHDMTVNPLPTPGSISGTAVVCVAATTTLSNGTSGGTWSSSDVAVATIGTDGVVTGVATGTATISYAITNACGAGYATIEVTVGTAPASIAGSGSVCLGGSTTLSVADAGGTWSSSNPAQAVVDASTGVVTSVSLGTTIISYVSGSGCSASSFGVTVNSTVAGITGVTHACAGQTSTLSNATSGGVWSTGNAAIATVDASTGVVTGVAPGSTTISYTIAGGCFTPVTFFVYAMPEAITGVSTLCTGSYTVLYSTIGGSGIWISSDTSIANPDSTSGMIHGMSVGSTMVTYQIPATGCYVTNNVTVNQTPDAITGTSPLCVGDERTFVNTTSGGTWSSSQPTVATIDATGIVNALTAGGAIVSYTMPTGCYSIYITTVNPIPTVPAASSTNICLGVGTTFSAAPSGGTWSSSDNSIATINVSTGVATSADLGTSTITYTGTNGCANTAELTVYSALAAIVGEDIVCKGYSTTLTNATSGGTWISSNSGIAAISGATGVTTGMNGGTAAISYRLSGGCLARKTVSVAAITGNIRMCVGLTSTLSHLIPGGTWSCSAPATATIDASTGVVTGITPGSAIITYNLGSGVYNTTYIIISSLPAAITGVSGFCEGSYAVYTGTAGGSATWSSSDVSVATIYSTSGLTYGVAAGTATLTYKVPTSGCYTTRTISVNPAPATITGASTLCVASSITLASATTGGTWSCTSNGVGTIDAATGTFTGNTGGATTVSYTLSNGCRKIKPLTVNVIPATLSGPSVVTEGGASTFSCSTSGGTWSSSNTSIALPATTTGFSGSSTTSLVSGVASGSATISYTLASGCYRSMDVTVVAAKPGAPIRTADEGKIDFSVYPNPTNGSITIASSIKGEFFVYTFDGKLVQQYPVSASLTSVSLPEGLASGVYMCQFRMEDGNIKTVRLVCQH